MNKSDLVELIRSGENSGVEFKRADLRPQRLAAEIAALLNLEGGYIFLGIEDNGSVAGLTREPRKVEEWVMEIARTHVLPATIPYWETVDWGEGKIVGIISLPRDAPDKPYKAKRGENWVTQVRVGTTTRAAGREEEERLYLQGVPFRYGLKPVLGTALDSLDQRHLRDYFGRVLGGSVPPANDVDRYLGPEPDYATRADEDLKGPMVPLCDPEDGELVKLGLVDKAWDFVRRNTTPSAYLEGARRIDRWDYPESAVREAVVNALVHRDYSIVGTDIMLVIFSDRLEVVSPGRLPNTVTPAGVRLGMRYARNQTLVNVMRDYGYVDARGMGIRNKIIPGMLAHNGTEPDLIEEEYRFTVRLWKGPKPS